MIVSDYACTGDGLVAALQVLAARIEANCDTSALCHRFDPVPQLHGVAEIHSASDVIGASDIKAAISDAEKQLGDQGRLVVRKSGTEPLIRIMVESRDRPLGASLVSALKEQIDQHVQNEHAIQS